MSDERAGQQALRHQHDRSVGAVAHNKRAQQVEQAGSDSQWAWQYLLVW